MTEQKSQRSLTQIIKKNKVEELIAKVDQLENELTSKEILLINLEKLSSMGQFLREIVHELKNPLSAISGYTELGKLAKTKKDRDDYLEKIPTFINQITSRLSQFRSMTFNTGIEYKSIDIMQILVESLSTLELLKPKGTEIESNFLCKECKVFGDAEQWIQVFLGVSRSFFNYMKETKTTLKVTLRICSSSELKSKSDEIIMSSIPKTDWDKKIEKRDKWIIITFENKKINIPDDKIKTALNYTSKIENLKTIEELGLVIACDIIRRHNGNIITSKNRNNHYKLDIICPVMD